MDTRTKICRNKDTIMKAPAGWVLLLKSIFLEFYSVLTGRFCPQKSLVKGIKTHAIFGLNNLNFAEGLFWLNYR